MSSSATPGAEETTNDLAPDATESAKQAPEVLEPQGKGMKARQTYRESILKWAVIGT